MEKRVWWSGSVCNGFVVAFADDIVAGLAAFAFVAAAGRVAFAIAVDDKR